MSSNLITPEAILSYVNLFSPRAAAEGADPKYSCAFVFPEGTDLSELKRAVIETAKEEWGSELDGAGMKVVETQYGPRNFLVAPSGLRILIPWRDQPEDIASKPGYPEGSTFINARSNESNPPEVVSRIADPSADGKPAQIVNPSGDLRFRDGTTVPGARPVYSGAKGRGLLSVFAYSNSGNHGVSFGLTGVQVTDDGERLDGRASAQDSFDADVEAADLSDLTDDGDQPAAAPAGATAGADGDDISDLLG